MSWVLSYFDETYDLGAASGRLLASAHRIFYVFAGSARIGGSEVEAGTAVYRSESPDVLAGPRGARIFRWDLGKGEGELASSRGVSSRLRMRQPIWSLAIEPGSSWLFRLDRIDNPAGIVADVHTHPGPGIRALLAGTFHVRQPSEDGAATSPGDPWWESGVEAVISMPGAVDMSSFLRCMILPVANAGRPDTAKWLRATPSVRAGWHLYVDEVVTL